MASYLLALFAHLMLLSPLAVQAQDTTTAAASTVASTAATTAAFPSFSSISSYASIGTIPNNTATGTSTLSSSVANYTTAPDVYLNVQNLSVGRIELDVDNLQANINLNAAVANNLVVVNAGVQVSVQNVNLTIVDVEAELELIVRLGNLADIVNRVFESLDLNPLLITALSDVTSAVDAVVGAVDSLLGSITQGGTTLSFIVDNLGNIVQEVGGVSTIVGDYLTNMTFTGATETLSNGDVQKTYSYSPLNALVNIVFNSAGQILQATTVKQTTSSTTTSSATATSTASST